MRAIGAHVAVRDQRYLAGFAVVNDTTLERELSLAAPRDEDEAAQLRELFSRARDLIDHHEPDLFALRVSEIAHGQRARAVAHRAEGAILAAAGQTRDLPVSLWVRPSLAARAGQGGGASAEVVARLCARLSQEPTGGEVKQAAAAAVAALATAR